MFAAIADFADAEQFNEHRTVYLLTQKGSWRLQSVSLVHCSGSESIVQTIQSDAASTSYVADKIDRSIVVQPGGARCVGRFRFFMFSTCDSDAVRRLRAVLRTSLKMPPSILLVRCLKVRPRTIRTMRTTQMATAAG